MVATSAPTTEKPRSRRPWTPDDNDHLIYHWIKFEGKTQDWVAQAFDIHQSTVSRIIERYERWQAHAKERENGRLDPSERLRAQRWLTFERNERILASCLRIAHEMEGFCDVSQSVTTYNHKDPTRQADVRTVHSVLDRHGIAARFLRLAHRINMEQLKLAEMDQPPPARELTDEEFEAEEQQAAADAAEFAAAQAASKERNRIHRPHPSHETPETDATSHVTTTDHSPTHHSPAPPHKTHNLHTENAAEIAVSHAAPCTCVLELTAERISYKPCIIDCDQPPWPDENPLQSGLPITPSAFGAGLPTPPVECNDPQTAAIE